MKTILLIVMVTGISLMVSACEKEKDGVAPPPTPPKFYIEKKDESKLFLEPEDYLSPVSPNTILCC